MVVFPFLIEITHFVYHTGKDDNHNKKKIPRWREKWPKRHTPLVRANWSYLEGNVEQKLKTISAQEIIKMVYKDSMTKIIQNNCELSKY